MTSTNPHVSSGSDYSKSYQKRSQWKNNPSMTNFPTPSNNQIEENPDIETKHDEYLLKLEERNRMKKQLQEQNEAEKLKFEKEKGFNLYINGANTSRFDTQVVSRGLRKSQHQPTSRKTSKELENCGNPNDHRARTAPAKRKKWTQDNEIEIQTHRDGKLLFEGSQFQYKYSEDFTNSEELDSGVQVAESDDYLSASVVDTSEQNYADEEFNEEADDDEVTFDQKERDILRQSLRLDEILKESIRESIMDETPSDSEIAEDMRESVEIDFVVNKPKRTKEVKVLKSSSAKSESSRCYTPTGRFSRPYPDSKGTNSLTSSFSKGEKESKLQENFSKDETKTHETVTENTTSVIQSNGDVKNNETNTQYDNNDVKDVIEKFKKLGIDQRRMLLEVLSQENGDLSALIAPKEVKSARPTYTVSDKSFKNDSTDALSKSTEGLKRSSTNFEKVTSEMQEPKLAEKSSAIKTYRVNDDVGSSGDKMSLQQLIQSQSLSSETNLTANESIDIGESRASLRSEKFELSSSRPESQASLVSMSSGFEKPSSRPGSRQKDFNYPSCSEMNGNQLDNFERFIPVSSGNSEICKTICLKLVSNWGDPVQIGLTGVQFLDENNEEIVCSKFSVINALDQISDVKVLLNKKMKTTKSSNMWCCMYTKYPIELFFSLNAAKKLTTIKLWNFNKSPKELNKGVRNFEVKIDNVLVFSGELEKGCGNHIFDYEKIIHIEEKPQVSLDRSNSISKSFVLAPDSARSNTFNPPTASVADVTCPDDSEFSLEELLTQSSGRKPVLTSQQKDKTMPKKVEPAGVKPKKSDKTKRKQLAKLSGIFDSLDLTTNEEFHYQPTPVPDVKGSDNESARKSDYNEDPISALNDRLDESWSHIFAFERARSGRQTAAEKKSLDVLNELEPKICSTKGAPMSVRTFSTDSNASLGDSQSLPNFESELRSVDWDSFTIPELPSGTRLVVNILSTWGDKHYVGLNGIELFDSRGQKVKFAKIEADPSDINVLPEYSKDPRVVTNLIDGVNNTRDDTHMWLAPFTASQNHFVFLTLEKSCTLAMMRFWNYSKSRVHSSRGAKLIQVHLDGNPIFRGEIQRAGELGENFKETYGDTVMLTMDANILSMVSENDELFLNDWNESLNCDESDRPMTAGEDSDVRPITVASNQKPGCISDCAIESMFDIDSQGEQPKVTNRCNKVVFELLEPWGDAFYMGLTGLQLLDESLHPIKITAAMINASPADLNTLPEYTKDVRTLDKLIDGENLSNDDRHMWLIPYTPNGKHLLTINLPEEAKSVAGFDVWNYNKSWEDSFRGVKRLKVYLDESEVSPANAGFTLRRAPGHTSYNFRQRVEFNKYSPYQGEIPDCPCGFVYTIMVQSSQNDLYYVGLDGIELLDDRNVKIRVKANQIDAYPRSVNELENAKSDIRTPDKLVDGVNSSRDGSHSWLAPIFPKANNKIYLVFDQPQPVSQIRVWNYSKTPSRGVKEVAVLVDDLIQYQGVLKPAMNVARGILPGMEAEVRCQVIDLKGFNPEQNEVQLEDPNQVHDSVKVQQTATGNNTSDSANQRNRPKTCVPRK